MEQTIENSQLSISVKNHGAELFSIKSKSGKEYIWEANPAIWGRHAPILFPVVGKLKEDHYSYEGKRYSLNQHGFARNMDFALIKADSESLLYRLSATAQTKKDYPFDFLLSVSYRLIGNAVDVEYRVENKGDCTMPFSIGAHPAFALNWGIGDKIEDYFLEFDKPETVVTHHLDKDSLLSKETEPVLSNEKRIPLKADMFNRDALIFLDLVSKKISLCSSKHATRLSVEFADFPFLGIWAKPKAPYVCIEPWHGYVDPAGVDGILMNKPGIINLDPMAVFSCMHRIIISE